MRDNYLESLIAEKLRHAIGLLRKKQRRDGGYASLSTEKINDFNKAKIYSNTFFTSLILAAAASLKGDKELDSIKKRSAEFLLAQRSADWTFNYWERNSEEAKKMPYPDDLDDTFCALSALFLFDKKLISAQVLAKAVAVLTYLEVEEGGPYRTWLVPRTAGPAWQDVDLAVNANIAFFLALNRISLPRLNNFIESRIDEGEYASPYYPDFFPVIYFISRAYRGKKGGVLSGYLLSRKKSDGLWGSPLQSALAISALVNLGTEPRSLKQELLKMLTLSEKEIFKSYAFCVDPAVKGVKHYAGSSELTAVFYLEALNKLRPKKRAAKAQAALKKNGNSELVAVRESVGKFLEKRLRPLGGELRRQGVAICRDFLKKDRRGEVSLLPYYFKLALKKYGREISNELIVNLGAANSMGWIAYKIYDDILDEDGGEKMLPLANLFLREVTASYFRILGPDDFDRYFSGTMDTIDAANTWEAVHCRLNVAPSGVSLPGKLPSFGSAVNLSDRSLGHLLAPLAILLSLDRPRKEQEIKSLSEFFRNYLAARQLNDDLHDWEKDLLRGQINYAGSAILKRLKRTGPNGIKSITKDNISRLQKIFWHDLAEGLCDEVITLCKNAEGHLSHLALIEKPIYLKRLLMPLQKSAEKALLERKRALDFLENYAGKSKLADKTR